jgi:acetolactate synthase-1/2/3 large subunit
MEVHTAVEYAAPVTFVIFNNNAHAMCALREEFLQGGVRNDDLFARTDLAAAVAAAFPSLDATGARDASQLHTALLRGNTSGGPAFVAVNCDPREIPPFLPFQSFTDTTDITESTNGTENKESSDERGIVHVG